MTNIILALVAAAALAMQTSSTQVEPQRATAAADRVTVTGCVERADQMQQPSTTGTTVDSLSFVLVKAKDTNNEPPTATGTTGATRTAGATESDPRLYRLDAAVEKLNPHVGHKVEITGTVSGATADVGTPAKLKVEEVKMISSTCQR
jgi:hypothetical protein